MTHLRAMWAAAALVGGAVMAAEPERWPECLVTCKNAESCEISEPGDLAKSRELRRSEFKRLDACNLRSSRDQPLLIRYLKGGRWFQAPTVGQNASLQQAVFEKNIPDQPCSLPSERCLQERMRNKTADSAGHGVDSQAAQPAGSNDPCARGLPCGTVLPPGDHWNFRLVDPVDGALQLRLTRGTPPDGVPAEIRLPVQAGQVDGAGRLIKPGGVYEYNLLDAGGNRLASGEFVVLSAVDYGRLKTLAAKRIERDGMAEQPAWIDTLLLSQLDWDAGRLLNGR